MMREILVSIVFGLTLAPAIANAADAAQPAAPASKPGNGARATDPLANLKPYEERRYRIEMQDCDKQKGVDRKLCERTVRNKAAAKSRRRATAH